MRVTGRHAASARSRFELGSDERLIARLRAGDTRAFETIYDRYERPIRSFCRHMLGQPEDADDAAQHVFLSAYKALIGTANAIELKPWLFAIARNRCRTMLRGRQRGLGIAEAVEREPSVEGLTVEVERREHLHDLLRDISRLPEEQRAALILTQLETLRHDDVARVLAVPPDKVKALVFQARESLMASQQARETPCREIREQLATLSGAGLRRRTLRRHVRDCTGCRDFELGLARQRVALSALLPVAATPVVRQVVIGHALGGGGQRERRGGRGGRRGRQGRGAQGGHGGGACRGGHGRGGRGHAPAAGGRQRRVTRARPRSRERCQRPGGSAGARHAGWPRAAAAGGRERRAACRPASESGRLRAPQARDPRGRRSATRTPTIGPRRRSRVSRARTPTTTATDAAPAQRSAGARAPFPAAAPFAEAPFPDASWIGPAVSITMRQGRTLSR